MSILYQEFLLFYSVWFMTKSYGSTELINFGFKSGINVLDNCNNCPVTVTLWYNHVIYQTAMPVTNTSTWYLSSTFTLLGLSDCLPNTGNSETKVMIDSNTPDTLKLSHIKITTANDWYGIASFRTLRGEVNGVTCFDNKKSGCGAVGTGGIYKQMFHFDITKPNEWIESQLIDAKDNPSLSTNVPSKSPSNQPTLVPTRNPTSIPSTAPTAPPSSSAPTTRQRERPIDNDVETTKDEENSENEGVKGEFSSIDPLLFIGIGGGILCAALCSFGVVVWCRIRNRKAMTVVMGIENTYANGKREETQDISSAKVAQENPDCPMIQLHGSGAELASTEGHIIETSMDNIIDEVNVNDEISPINVTAGGVYEQDGKDADGQDDDDDVLVELIVETQGA
eukprot:604211_1